LDLLQDSGNFIALSKGSAMDNKLMNDINKTTALLVVIAYFFFGYYQNFFDAIGILLGAGWGIANIFFLKKTLEEWLLPKDRNNLIFYTLLQIKFPLLYLIGYGLLWMRIFSVLSLLIGFSLVFIAIFLLGLVNIFDKTKTTSGSC
jgi:hypothetical protein